MDAEVGEAVDEAVVAKEAKEEGVETRDQHQLPRRYPLVLICLTSISLIRITNI